MKLFYKILKSVSLAIIGLWCFAQTAFAQPTANLLHHFSFNYTLSNAAGTHTISGISSFVADRSNTANYAYDVSDDNYTLSSTFDNLPTGGTSRTIAFWFQVPNVNKEYHLFSYGTMGSAYSISYNSITGNLVIGNGINSVTYYIDRTTDWRHIAISYDNSNFRHLIYVNGSYLGYVALNTSNTVSSPLKIGENSVGTKGANFKIDELFIYNTVLSATEISTIYNLKCRPNPVGTSTKMNVCPGESVKLTFDKVIYLYNSSGTRLTLNDTYTTSNLNTTTTFYMIDSISSTCYSNRVPITITVDAAAPMPMSTTDPVEGNICGTSGRAILKVQNNPNYTAKWYSSSIGGSPIATGSVFETPVLSSNTQYYVAYEAPNLCPSKRATEVVWIYPKYEANLVSNKTQICPGESVVLSGFANTPHNLYKNGIWVSGGDIYSEIPSSFGDAPTSTSTYVLEAGEWLGCLSKDTVVVTVNATPSVTISASKSTLCTGESLQLTASGASSYVWSNASTQNTITVSPTSSTTYNVTGTSNGCSKSATYTVTVTDIPNVSINSTSATICEGESTSLTASGADSYVWSNSATTATINLTPATTTTYTVTGTSNGCSNTATTTVTVNPIPNVTIDSPTQRNICAGESITLTASGADEYKWSNYSSASSITVSPSTTTIYNVTGTSLNCHKSTYVEVNVNAIPTVSISPSSTTICEGESATLTASGASTYLWSTSATTASITESPITTTTYTVTGTKNGCSKIATATVTVQALPNVTVSPTNETICAGESIILTASGASSYAWLTSATTASITESPVASTTYTVTGTSNGCSKTVSAVVNVKSLPILNIIPSSAMICEGESVTLEASGADSYTWSTSNTSEIITVSPEATTIYSVSGTTNGCSNTKEVTVTIKANPKPVINQTGNTLSTDNFDSYQWYFENNEIINAISQNYQVVNSGNYTVRVTENGCSATSTPQEVLITGLFGGSKSLRTLEVYPNPASSIVQISSLNETKVNIYTLHGAPVGSFIVQAGLNTVNIEHLHSGIYILQTEKGEGIKLTIE